MKADKWKMLQEILKHWCVYVCVFPVFGLRIRKETDFFSWAKLIYSLFLSKFQRHTDKNIAQLILEFPIL